MRKAFKKTNDVTADTLFVNSKGLHSKLHPVKTSRLPNEVRSKVVRAIDRDIVRATKFKSDFVRDVCWL